MLDAMKSNDIHNGEIVKTPDTSSSHSSINLNQVTENGDFIIDIISTTDVLTDLMTHLDSKLIDLKMHKNANNELVFILRDTLFSQSTNQDNQLCAMWRIQQENAIRAGLKAYNFAIANDMNADKASSILPVGNTMIEATLTLKNNIGEIIENLDDKKLSKECIELIGFCKEII